MGRQKPPPPPPVVQRHLFSLTEATVTALESLARECSDVVGRAVSMSAVVRALVTHTHSAGYQWLRTEIVPLIETEQRVVQWGSRPRKTRT